jgi:hypothetical protein
MLKILQTRIERQLYKRGFHVPDVRKMAGQQMELMLLSVLALPLGRLGFDYFAGVALATLNFLALARIIQELVYLRKGAVSVQLFSFYGRLILTAGVLFVLIAYAGSSVSALLVGLSTVLINILLWGLSQLLGKKSKEA